MINSLLIGKHIFKILSESETIKKYIGNKIFPIVCESGTKFPFIVYHRTGISTTYHKDGILKDVVTVEFNVVSDDYYKSSEIANELRHLLEMSIYNSDELKITNIQLLDVNEDFVDNAYVQTLSFGFDIK